jgi:DNA-binding NarL/FixJ family response regulator
MKIVLVDDHPLIRDAIVGLVMRHASGARVFCASDCQSGIALTSTEKPDLVLLDLGLPDICGVAAIDAMRNAAPDIPVVVLSGTVDRDVVTQAIDRGARGYIPKNLSPALIWSALGLVLSGAVFVPDLAVGGGTAVAGRQAAGGNPPSPEDVLAAHGLTGRQRDILRSLVEGLSNKEIARRFDLAEPTVKAHVSAVLRALNVGSRTQAVLWLGHHGIAPGDL